MTCYNMKNLKQDYGDLISKLTNVASIEDRKKQSETFGLILTKCSTTAASK